MTLLTDAAANRSALVAQLYDDWHGRYVVQRLDGWRIRGREAARPRRGADVPDAERGSAEDRL